MPVSAAIYNNAPRPQFENKPFSGLDSLVKMQENAEILKQRRLQNEKLQRDADEEQAFHQIVSSSDGDWETTYAALIRSAPSLAPKYMEDVQRERVARFQAMKEESAAELAEAQYGLRSLQVMIDAPELAPDLLPVLAKRVPELAPMLQQLNPQDPNFTSTLKAIQKFGLTAKEQTEREDKWNDAFLKGDFRYAGEVLAQAEDKQEAMAVLNAAGMPKAAVQAIAANPSAWRMTASERSQEQDRTADNTRDASQFTAQQTERERANRADEANTRRGQDVSAGTQRRGQDLDLTLGRERLAQDKTKPGADGKPAPNVGAIMEQIDTLSQKINTEGGGPGANLTGLMRRGRAALNLDNDVAEYEALIKGMIPMVARAVGHTGVLTQQDVDSVRNLFPRVGDNSTLAKNKMARIKQLIGDVQPTAATTTPDAPSGRVGPYTYRVRPR